MITITIKTDNAAFQESSREWEIARILEELARKYRDGFQPSLTLDINGNTVGTVTDTD